MVSLIGGGGASRSTMIGGGEASSCYLFTSFTAFV